MRPVASRPSLAADHEPGPDNPAARTSLGHAPTAHRPTFTMAEPESNLSVRPRVEALRGRPQMLRAHSELGSRGTSPRVHHSHLATSNEDVKSNSAESDWVVRHGFEGQLFNEEYNHFLSENFFMYYTDKKHETGGNPRPEHWPFDPEEWRNKDRLKTVAAVLVLCLNLGVDPPDVIKTNPCAKLECWVDPGTAGSHGVINQIGKALQSQYEQLSMRTRYRQVLDPTSEDTRKHCQTLRRNARNERVLFHYNGHGVPRPTASGEIWVYNKNFTQYIPLSLYDLQSWLQSPVLLVWDCSDAGLIVKNYNKLVVRHEEEVREARREDPHAEFMEVSDCIHLGACQEKEVLPTNPDLPADLFTACLTTPIEMALRFFVLQNPLAGPVTLNDVANIPGRISERRTPIGELNWIFTAITDTIAWNTLPTPLFKKLFRQDLMVAALFRNFLLAQRIMRLYHCKPVSHPAIPNTHDHPLWKSWDLAVEMILSQLPDMLAADRNESPYQYQHSEFFAEQLTAFEVYLTQGALEKKQPPQLPIVLQVLLSQVHRLRALIGLSKFLDLGPWAVNLALSIGIFPYVLKLLQSQAIELKAVMIFIWARILAVDQSCQGDLLKDNGYQYFISILNPQMSIPIQNLSEHRAMCAFVISMFCKDYHQAQVVCLSQGDLIESLLSHLDDMHNPLLRQWACICLSNLWVDYPEAKWAGIRCDAHQKLCDMVVDPVAEVRSAMLHALTTFLKTGDLADQATQIEESVASMLLIMAQDGNSMVRKELLVFFSTFVARYLNRFRVAAFESLEEEHDDIFPPSESDMDELESPMEGLFMKSTLADSDQEVMHDPSDMLPDKLMSKDTVYEAIWSRLLILSTDPHPEVARDAGVIVDHVLISLMDSPLADDAEELLEDIIEFEIEKQMLDQLESHNHHIEGSLSSMPQTPAHHSPIPSNAGSAKTTPPTQDEGYMSAGFRRTASVAASLVNLVSYGAAHSEVSSPAAMHTPQRAQTYHDRNSAPRARLPDEWHSVSDAMLIPLTLTGKSKVPPPRHFTARNEEQEVHGPPFPLVSHFFEWSVEYFREPQMKPSEADEPGSTDYNQRLWRRNRNDQIIAKTQPQKEVAGSNRWDKPRAVIANGSQPIKMCFHQFEDHLVVTDDKDSVRIWDWRKSKLLNRFSNGNPGGSKITEVRLINEDDTALLMTGSSDGVIKLWRHYETPMKADENGVELVTAFRALNELVTTDKKKSPGLVFDWQQSRGLVLVAGDVRVIRIWNAGTEICTADIPARSGSPITGLTSDQVEGNIVVAGFGDGVIRVYDQRLEALKAMVKMWREDRQWITNVHLQRGGQRELVTGCRGGEVRIWDMRMDRSLKTITATRDTLRTLSVHEHAPVFATGTERHTVKLFNISSSTLLSSFEPYSNVPVLFNQTSRAPIASTTFHPHRMMIAGAAMHSSAISIMACQMKPPVREFEDGVVVKGWED